MKTTMTLLALGILVFAQGCSRQQAPAVASAPAAAAQSGESPPGVDSAAASAYQAQMQKDQSEHPTLAIGAAAPDFTLRGTDGKMHSLKDYADAKVLVVVFVSNHCPASQLYEGRIKAIVNDYAGKGLKLLAIAPNGPDAVSPRELNYSDVDDSFESMKIRADYRKFNFDYLYDGDTQSVSHAYGPKVTPHIFVFDAQRKLRYEGRIDDRMQAEKVSVNDARNAIDALVAGQPVAVPHTPVFGCSTKWKSHADNAKKEMQEWLASPVTLASASIEDLRKLRSNPDRKTLMVNFWATWCAPCQIEYPELLETYLWYRSRDFEFVSVSVDEPAQKAAVQKFLEKTHSAIRNLQVDTEDVYAVMAAFDKSWESGVPFTMVIAPDGRVIFQHSGQVDKLALRRAILGHLPDAGMFAGNTGYWREN
ncbi:MAG: redoxin domain-containing protein [Steroidobacteraceae bacterium]